MRSSIILRVPSTVMYSDILLMLNNRVATKPGMPGNVLEFFFSGICHGICYLGFLSWNCPGTFSSLLCMTCRRDCGSVPCFLKLFQSVGWLENYSPSFGGIRCLCIHHTTPHRMSLPIKSPKILNYKVNLWLGTVLALSIDVIIC